jgi:NAD(P)-dependent dehydrogenase (short-subunit alcohol dehydrogenase family)
MTEPMHTSALFSLDGKVAIVTGGGRGIGLQMATGLGEMGASLVLCGRKADTVELAAGELRTAGIQAIGLACDVRAEDDVEAVVRRTVAEFGRIDILVNNAGTVWSGAPEEVQLEGWQKVVDVNLTGVFICARTAGRVMIRQRAGRIINIASVAAFKGAPPEIMDTISYQATKGAVVSLTRDLAVKWARHGINVNAIAPGWFPSDMTATVIAGNRDRLEARTPCGRLGGPNDLKGAVVYLASAASSWVTGHTLVVDGGESAW